MLATLFTVLGIGLLLFFHEGGHYLAARAAGVRVDVFSLGFGPRLFGFKKGDTDYRISLIPLGGYVRMAGEENSSSPDGLLGKSVGWRFLIFAGGILANFLIALIIIPILFAVGVPLEAPIAGPIEAGSPAWHAGILEGDRVLSANDETLHAFRHVSAAVALNEAGSPLVFQLQSPDGQSREVHLAPEYDANAGFARVGMGIPERLVFHPTGPAIDAGFEPTDEITKIGDVVVSNRPAVARLLLSQATRLQRTIEITATSQDGISKTLTLSPTAIDFQDAAPLQIGVFALSNQVAENLAPSTMPFQKGDTIHSVNGQALSTIDDLAEALLDSSRPTFVQYGSPVQDFIMPSGYTPENLYAALHLSQAPGLAVSVRPQSAAFEAGIQNGDCILRANDKPIYSLSNLRQAILPLDLGQELPLSLSRGDETIAIVVQPKLATAFHYGVAREVIEETVRANGPLHALTLGLSEASRMGLEVVRTLSRVLGGGIDSSNLGGIMTIGVITHSFAEQGWIPLLFFLCMISIHLGVLNLLPIPGLDGGHLMFLIYELLRGKPVSEQAQGMINLAGFLLVISMVIFVTTLDIQRFFS